MDKHSQAIGEVYIGGHVINHWLVGSVQTNIVRQFGEVYIGGHVINHWLVGSVWTNIVRQSVRCILEDML